MGRGDSQGFGLGVALPKLSQNGSALLSCGPVTNDQRGRAFHPIAMLSAICLNSSCAWLELSPPVNKNPAE